MPAPPPPPYTPTPQELAALRAALDADSSILTRLARSGEAGLGGGCTEWPAPVLTRWLVAEGGSVPKAAARLAEHASWRAERLPDGWTAEKGACVGERREKRGGRKRGASWQAHTWQARARARARARLCLDLLSFSLSFLNSHARKNTHSPSVPLIQRPS